MALKRKYVISVEFYLIDQQSDHTKARYWELLTQGKIGTIQRKKNAIEFTSYDKELLLKILNYYYK